MLLALLALIALAGQGPAQEVRVWSGSLPPPESVMGNNCNVAAVRRLAPGSRLTVRRGPGPGYAAKDHLPSGTQVFTCNEYRDAQGRRWDGIAYRAKGKPCRGATKDGLDIPLSRGCRTGWVSSTRIEVISG